MIANLETLAPRKTQRYGWRPQRPDHRDFQYTKKAPKVVPAAIDRFTYPLISAYDQSNLGSCTGNGCGRIFQYRGIKEFGRFPTPSRLFIYWWERFLEGTVKTDSGAEVRDGLKVLAQYGAPPETDWPYDIRKFATKPPTKASADAKKHIGLQYQAVVGRGLSGQIDAVRTAIANLDPVVFGFAVRSSFESVDVANAGIYSPTSRESVIGGHCVVFDGYDDKTETFWCANSWGADWGLQGWFRMRYETLKDCADFWVLDSVK